MRIVKRPELMEMLKKRNVIYSNVYSESLDGLNIASYFF